LRRGVVGYEGVGFHAGGGQHFLGCAVNYGKLKLCRRLKFFHIETIIYFHTFVYTIVGSRYNVYMQINIWLRRALLRLDDVGIGTARLDALVLLEDVTGRDRAWLLANLDHELSLAKQAKLTKLLNRRAQHTPLAYVRGKTEFYGRNFVITPAVLEPRPESETMIDLLKKLSATGKLLPKNSKYSKNDHQVVKIADVGAGSGALGITAKLEFPEDREVAVDLLEVDSKALEIAKINVDKHTTNIGLAESDLLEKSSKDYDILLCNLPYVPDGHTVNQAAMHEPKIAIFGGPDGLDVYRRLFEQLASLTKRPLFILTESLPPQHDALAAIAKQAGYQLNTTDDFIQVFRFTAA
jgi:release factor glutamine methyltransferase